MNFSHQHLVNQAALLARKHPSNNPLLNPSAMAQYSGSQQQLISAIAQHPVASQIATNVAASTASGAPAAGASPIDGHPIYKTPTTRHNIVGFLVNGTIAGGALSSVQAVPQNPFTASRMVIGATSLGAMNNTAIGPAYIGNWKVGAKSQFASIGQEPMGLFAAGLAGGRLRFTKCPAAIAISANVQPVAGGTAAFYAALIGTSGRRKDNGRPPPQFAKEDRIAIPPVSVAPGVSGIVTVTPTRRFWGTRIVLDDSLTGTYGLNPGTGASNFALSDLLVGADTQFMSAAVAGSGIPYVPAGIFNGLHSPDLDLDRADTAVPISFEYTNVGSVTALFGGVILGDVDKRADVESDDPSID